MTFSQERRPVGWPEAIKRHGRFALINLMELAPNGDLKNSDTAPIYTHRGYTIVRCGNTRENYIAMLEFLLDQVTKGKIDGNKISIYGWVDQNPPRNPRIFKDGWVLFTNKQPEQDAVKFFVRKFNFDI